ncbi:MAG: glycosyltransferase [Clostridiales bacterium]|nr:glycosyltransferase [Clostridiales bacterium]
MRVALINVTASGGTGKFCVELSRQTMERGHTVLFCHARSHCPGDVPSCRVCWYSGAFAFVKRILGSGWKYISRFFGSLWRYAGLKFGKTGRKKAAEKGEADLKNAVLPRTEALRSDLPSRKRRGRSGRLPGGLRVRSRHKPDIRTRIQDAKRGMDKGKVKMKRAIHPRTEFFRSNINTYTHGVRARLTDRQGFFSKQATRRLVEQLRSFQPDVIHLNNLHGYYLHMPTLFLYLREEQIPVVWTLHDLWAVTGHCAFPSTAVEPFLTDAQEQMYLSCAGDAAREAEVDKQICREGCLRWQTGCGHCVMKGEYPRSWFRDQSARNWREKRALFSGHPYMVLTVPSRWMEQQVRKSFLSGYPLHYMPHGLDMNAYRPCVNVDERIALLKRLKLWEMRSKYLLVSVASLWESRKGLEDLMDLKELLGEDYCVVAVGLDEDQRAAIPDGSVIALEEMGNRADLCALYTAADLFVSLSRAESMGMRPLQAMACGTQVLCWDATAMPELITNDVGLTAELGNLQDAADKVRWLCENPASPEDCRRRAMEYEAGHRNRQFVYLYEGMHENGPAAS